jgi:hypothetical protein
VSHDRKDFSLLITALVVAVSFGLTVWYAVSVFIPVFRSLDVAIGFDAYRYHFFAERNASNSLSEILGSSELVHFGRVGYPALLSLLYGLTTPDPVVGCVLNWLLWVTAGFLLVPLARPEGDYTSRVPFLAVWLLYPESIDWNGTTSKEPLVVFLVACALRTCSSRLPRWGQLVIVGVLAGLMFFVRGAAAPLLLLGLAISIESRWRSQVSRTPRVVLLAVALLVGLYMTGGDVADDGESDNPLAVAGYSAMVSAFSDNLSRLSILRRLGSPDRIIDILYVPLRGIAHLLTPLFTNPLILPFAAVARASGLVWMSAGVCSAAALAILLRLFDRERWTEVRAVLFGVLVVGLLTLGFSGAIIERYRSIIVAALLPLGVRSFREELAAHGSRRLVIGGAVLPLFVFLLYRILRQFS